MKKTIKDFLLKKRFFKKGVKVLKNKKGFSLMEVLIAVAIIGIISGIAVPQFIAQRNNAAKVAADTSAGNIAKAFKHCLALKDFSRCNSLSAIKVSCPAGSSCDSGGAGNVFCAHLHRGDAGATFNVCIEVDGEGKEARSYGGDLLDKDQTVCKKAVTGCTNTASNEAIHTVPGLIKCTTGNVSTVCGAGGTDSGTNCTTTFTCATVTTTGTCDKSKGRCE